MADEHTPGPWRIADSDCVYGGDNKELAHMVGEADARLIAAAPALLAALEAVVKDNDGYCYRCEKENDHGPACPIPTARAAIAKARQSG